MHDIYFYLKNKVFNKIKVLYINCSKIYTFIINSFRTKKLYCILSDHSKTYTLHICIFIKFPENNISLIQLSKYFMDRQIDTNSKHTRIMQ